MKIPRSSLLVVAAVGAAVLALTRHPRGPDETGPGPAVELSFEVIQLRIFAKEAIAREAAAGRRSLLEAAALFRELNRVPPRAAPHPGADIDRDIRLPARTDEQRACREVLAYVLSLRGDLVEPDAVVQRLEAEFWDAAPGGSVRLPDPQTLEPARALLERARGTLNELKRGIAPAHIARRI